MKPTQSPGASRVLTQGAVFGRRWFLAVAIRQRPAASVNRSQSPVRSTRQTQEA
jgi:hypothetical protein